MADAVTTTQAAPASRQGSGAWRNSMNQAITRPTLIAAISMTATAETSGATAWRDNPQVDAAVLSISSSQTSSTDPTAVLKAGHLNR